MFSQHYTCFPGGFTSAINDRSLTSKGPPSISVSLYTPNKIILDMKTKSFNIKLCVPNHGHVVLSRGDDMMRDLLLVIQHYKLFI